MAGINERSDQHLHLEVLENLPELFIVLHLIYHIIEPANKDSAALVIVHYISEMLLSSNGALPIVHPLATLTIPISPPLKCRVARWPRVVLSPRLLLLLGAASTGLQRPTFNRDPGHVLNRIICHLTRLELDEAVSRVAPSHRIDGYVDLINVGKALRRKRLRDLFWANEIEDIPS